MEMRAFQVADTAAMEALFEAVFTEADGAAEGAMVGKLARELMADTKGGDLYGFVAADESVLIGAILFSRLTFATDNDVFILSPVAVHSNCQGKGVGSALIRHGLDQLRNSGVQVVTTYGDPAYYTRLGFEPLAAQTIALEKLGDAELESIVRDRLGNRVIRSEVPQFVISKAPSSTVFEIIE